MVAGMTEGEEGVEDGKASTDGSLETEAGEMEGVGGGGGKETGGGEEGAEEVELPRHALFIRRNEMETVPEPGAVPARREGRRGGAVQDEDAVALASLLQEMARECGEVEGARRRVGLVVAVRVVDAVVMGFGGKEAHGFRVAVRGKVRLLVARVGCATEATPVPEKGRAD